MISRATRYGRLAGQILRANFARLQDPMKLTFAVTYWCQYKCKTCNIWKLKPENELTTDEILNFIRTNDGISWADITGGEIFLRNDAGDILEAMARHWKKLVFFHFPTNGFLTDKIVKLASRIGALGLGNFVITVSLDGYEELNDEIRGVKGGYRRQMETFNALRRIPGVRAVLGMTLSEHNLNQFQATFRQCVKDCPGLDIKDFHLNVMQLSDHYYGNREMVSILPPRHQAACEVRSYRLLRGASISPPSLLEKVYLRNLEKFLETGRTPMTCHSLRSSCFIDPWGQVFPCITYSRPVGNLRETGMSLSPIWKGAPARELQEEIWKGDCPQCWTACEAYQSILGNALRVDNRRSRS